MPLTLAQHRVLMQDKVVQGVIDELRRNNFMLQRLPFDDTANPGSQGQGWYYVYTRMLAPSTVGTRALNAEYTNSEATAQSITTKLAIMGGTYKIDRTMRNTGHVANQVTFQVEQKTRAAGAYFNELVITGDTGVDANAFDGLSKILTGSSTEYNTGAAIALDSEANITANAKKFMNMMDEFLSELDGTPDALLVNRKLAVKIRAVGRELKYYDTQRDEFGRQVETYAGIPFVDLGDKQDGSGPIITTNGVSGETSLYAVRFGLDAFHGIAPNGGESLINSALPNFDGNDNNAVAQGYLEMVTSVALKRTKSAGAFRRIKIQ